MQGGSGSHHALSRRLSFRPHNVQVAAHKRPIKQGHLSPHYGAFFFYYDSSRRMDRGPHIERDRKSNGWRA